MGSQVSENMMRLLSRWLGHRCMLIPCLVLVLLLYLLLNPVRISKPLEWPISPAHKQLVHEHVRRVLQGPCRPGGTRQNLLTQLSASGSQTRPFLWRGDPLSEDLFLYMPPFGFQSLQNQVKDLLQLLPAPDSDPLTERSPGECRRCVVVGNGGILKGLELGLLIDRFDTIIRLNSGPLGQFSVDVGNRTSIRMSYPEGTPQHWVDTDSNTVFVAVVYKNVDLSWISAMIRKQTVSLLDWLFFWQTVPDKIPLDPSKFRLLNPRVIRETALDLLNYPQPRKRLWGWDKSSVLW